MIKAGYASFSSGDEVMLAISTKVSKVVKYLLYLTTPKSSTASSPSFDMVSTSF